MTKKIEPAGRSGSNLSGTPRHLLNFGRAARRSTSVLICLGLAHAPSFLRPSAQFLHSAKQKVAVNVCSPDTRQNTNKSAGGWDRRTNGDRLQGRHAEVPIFKGPGTVRTVYRTFPERARTAWLVTPGGRRLPLSAGLLARGGQPAFLDIRSRGRPFARMAARRRVARSNSMISSSGAVGAPAAPTCTSRPGPVTGPGRLCRANRKNHPCGFSRPGASAAIPRAFVHNLRPLTRAAWRHAAATI